MVLDVNRSAINCLVLLNRHPSTLTMVSLTNLSTPSALLTLRTSHPQTSPSRARRGRPNRPLGPNPPTLLIPLRRPPQHHTTPRRPAATRTRTTWALLTQLLPSETHTRMDTTMGTVVLLQRRTTMPRRPSRACTFRRIVSQRTCESESEPFIRLLTPRGACTGVQRSAIDSLYVLCPASPCVTPRSFVVLAYGQDIS